MYKQSRIYTTIILMCGLLLSFSYFITAGQEKSKDGKGKPTGPPVLWRDPGDISSRSLLAGPGGDEMKPDLSKVTYVADEEGGYSVKYRVKDGAGRTWVVKLGNEARPEITSVRLLNALGYMTEISYLVPCVQIAGVTKPRKEVARCAGDGFADARFEARPDDVKRLDTWSWKNNPFVGTKEFKGLIILMALLNNWDLKDTNNKILAVKGANGQTELRYIISDLGATFGKTGGPLTHTRNEPEDYAKSKFIKSVEGDRVRFAYGGKSQFLFDNIRVEDARWIASLLARLSNEQIQDAFRAGNFKPAEIQVLAPALRSRIDELVRVTGATPAAPSMPAPTPVPSVTPQPTPLATPTPETKPLPEATPAMTPTPPVPTNTPSAPTPEATPSDTLPPPTPTPSPSPTTGTELSGRADNRSVVC